MSAPAAATSPATAPASTERYGRGTIVINLLKRAATWIFNAAVSKARAGWAAFKSWWSGISYWIRKPIEWAAGGGAYDVFTAILEWLRGVSRVDTSVG